MAVYAEDTFVDVAGTALDAHTPTGTTPGASWALLSGATPEPIIISPSGRTRMSASNAQRRNYRMARVGGGGVYPTDYSVEAPFTWQGDTTSLQNDYQEIGLRTTATNDGYVLQAYNYGGGSTKMRYKLIRITAGNEALILAQTADLTHPTGGEVVTCSITAIGTTLRCQAGGIDLFGAITDATYAGPGMPSRSGKNLNDFETDALGIHIGPITAKTAILATDTTHLAMVTQPLGAETGSAFLQQPAVELRDSLDAPVATAGVVVTASLLTGTGSIGGTLTAATNGAGRATFTNLQVTGTGAKTLAFDGPSLIRAVSSSFNVVASGKATHLVATQQPSGIAAGDGHRYPNLPFIVEARNNANALDATYSFTNNATISATRSGGGTTRLKGPTTTPFYLGVVKCYGTTLLDAATYTLTVAAPDLVPLTSSTFVVSAPIDTFYPDIEFGAALPRVTVPLTEPTQLGATFHVGPTDTYTTMTAAAAAYGAGTINPGDSIVVRDTYDLTEDVRFPMRAATAPLGVFLWLVVRRETSPTPDINTRVAPSHFAGKGTWRSSGPAHALCFANGANHIRIQGMQFDSLAAADTNTIIDCGFSTELFVPPWIDTTGGLPNNIILDRLYLKGNPSFKSRRGVLLNAAYNGLCASYLEGFHEIGQDSQAVMIYNTTGPARVYNNFLEGQSENMMVGGADVLGPQYIPTDITVTHNVFEKKLANKAIWTDGDEKNLFELKMGHRVLVEFNILQSFWDDAISQPDAFNIKSVNQSIDPAQDYTGTSNVIVRNNLLRNIASFFATAGRPQGQCETANRIVVRNNGVVNMNTPDYNGVARAFTTNTNFDVLYEHNTILTAPARGGVGPFKFNNTTDRTTIRSNAIIGESYDYVATGDNAAPFMTSVRDVNDPASIWLNNYIGGLTAGNFQDAGKIATTICVEVSGGAAVDPGFTNFNIRTGAETADPDAILAALIPTGVSVLHAAGHDGLDIGICDFPTLRAGLLGVLSGAPGVTPIADHIAIATQPSATAFTNVVLAQSLVVEIRDQFNALLTSATNLVTVSLESGTGNLLGTLSVAAVAGRATFPDLKFDQVGVKAIHVTCGAFAPLTTTPTVVSDLLQTADHLTIETQPSGAVSGVALTVQPVIKVRDVTGAVVTGFTGDLVVAVVSGTGSVIAGGSIACIAGVGTFSALTLAGLGVVAISFTAVGLPPIISAPFSLGSSGVARPLVWGSADLLRRFKRMAGLPDVSEEDEALDLYPILSSAQNEVIREIAIRYAAALYSMQAPTLLTASADRKTFTFGTDGNGNAIMPLGWVQISPRKTAFFGPSSVFWVEGRDFLDEGTQIRLPGDRTWAGELWGRWIPTPPDISAGVDPVMQPADARALIVIKAVWNWAAEGNTRPDLVTAMERLWAQKFPVWMLNYRRRFRGGGGIMDPALWYLWSPDLGRNG